MQYELWLHTCTTLSLLEEWPCFDFHLKPQRHHWKLEPSEVIAFTLTVSHEGMLANLHFSVHEEMLSCAETQRHMQWSSMKSLEGT